jgi:hypothetical protein
VSPFDTIFGLIMVGLCGAWLLAALTIGLCRAAAKPRPRPDEYEMSPYGPVNRFRNDLCMVATCNGVKQYDLGHGWIVCETHAREIAAGGAA